MSMLLCQTSIENFNEHSMEAVRGNQTHLGGNCSRQDIKEIKEGSWGLSPIHGKAGIDVSGIEPEDIIFEDGCAAILSAEPSLWNDGIAWLPKGSIRVQVIAGCKRRQVNGTWINDMGNRGSGYHKEFGTGVDEITRVTVNGKICYESGSVWLPNEGVDSLNVLTLDCDIQNARTVLIRVEQICESHILVDSSYRVMGWKALCDEDSIMTLIADRCKSSRCQTANPSSASARACRRVCEQMARRTARSSCMPRRSEDASCPNPSPSDFGDPHLGSSDYFIDLPRYTDYCKRFCDVVDDPSNSCMNNRVWHDFGQKIVCHDEREFRTSQHGSFNCSGWHWMDDDVFRAQIEVKGTDEATAIVVGDILNRFTVPAPKHFLFPLIRGEDKMIVSPSDGSYLNLSGFPNDHLVFTELELIDNPSAPIITDGIMLIDPEYSNGTFRSELMVWKADQIPLDMQVHIVTVADRVANLRGTFCVRASDCGENELCLDERCLDLEMLPHSFTLFACLEKAVATEISVDCEETICHLFLASDEGPVPGAELELACSGGHGRVLVTDIGGRSSFDPDDVIPRSCSVSFEGGGGYAPSDATFVISGHNLGDMSGLWGMAAFLSLLSLTSYAVKRKSLWGILSDMRGWLP